MCFCIIFTGEFQRSANSKAIPLYFTTIKHDGSVTFSFLMFCKVFLTLYSHA
uniref:Uncharacterized protein n=1 Tax=Rhizophora mucronata TaxID=61149 RepID=A0A2P2NLK2_RHIMU